MEDIEKKKTVKDLIKTFDSNPETEQDFNKENTLTQNEKNPLFPTLKKLPNNIRNLFTEEKYQNIELNNSHKNKVQTANIKELESNKLPKNNNQSAYKKENIIQDNLVNNNSQNKDIKESLPKTENCLNNKSKTEFEKEIAFNNNIENNQITYGNEIPLDDRKEKESDKNPFAFFWKNARKKRNKVKDDSNIISDKKNKMNEILTPPKKERRNSFNKKEVIDSSDNNEQTNSGDIPEVDEPVVPLTYKQTEELLKDPKFAKVKELKQHTDTLFNSSVAGKNKGHSNIVKSLVSQDKTRFCYDGFDLDLTYITMRIIAMGFPSKSIEGIYRNNMDDVKSFFAKRHPKHHKIYNLCDDKKYSGNCFYSQGYFPFKDHEAPPLNLIRPFCEDAKKFLDEDDKNVVAIHCLAGKGRTGTFICCLLLYLNFFETAEECLLYYGLMRVGTVKGVTVPSQIRYVHYFEYILNNKIPHPISFKIVIIKKVKMYTIPKINKKKFVPNFIIETHLAKIAKYSDINKKKETYTITDFNLPFIEFTLGSQGVLVSGDTKFTFYNVQLFKSEKMFKFWFNTNFLPQTGLYEIKKEGIDKACKDKKCKIYKEDFKIEIYYNLWN